MDYTSVNISQILEELGAQRKDLSNSPLIYKNEVDSSSLKTDGERIVQEFSQADIPETRIRLMVQELSLLLLCSACFLDRNLESTQEERKICHLYIQHRFVLFVTTENIPELEKISRIILETPNQWLNVLEICKSFTLIQATELVSTFVKEQLILNEFVKGVLVLESYLPEFYKERISKSIFTICQAIPHRALAIRYLLTTSEQLPDLALRITLDYCNDEIAYLNAIFNGNTMWIVQSLSKMQDVLLGLQKKLFNHLESVTLSSGRSSQIDACLILRVICAFGGLLSVKIPEQDVFKCLDLIKNAKTQRLVKLALCFITICYESIVRYSKNTLLDTLTEITKMEHSDTALLYAIYFRTNQFDQIENIVKTTLQMEVSVSKLGLVELKEIFAKTLFPADALARHALMLKPASFADLGTIAEAESLALTCFNQLLNTRVFQTYGFDIRNWVYQRIIEASLPVSPLLVELIQEYSSSILSTTTISKIPEKELRNIFSESGPISQKQVLLLLYILSYNQNVIRFKKETGQISEQYSDKLVDSIHVMRMLSYTANLQGGLAYKHLYPDLLALTSFHFPYLFNVTSLLTGEERLLHSASESMSIEHLESAITSAISNPGKILAIISSLNSKSSQDLLPHATSLMKLLLPYLISENVELRVLEEFYQLWEKLNCLIPEELSLLTINLLSSTPDFLSECTSQDLFRDPLILLKVHTSVFRKPPLYQIFLRILSIYMSASRQKYRRRFQMYHINNGKRVVFTEAHLTSMLYIQDTAIMQYLLDACQQRLEDEAHPDVLEEIRAITCGFLHQIFIENKLYIKLIHFQTYNPELLPVTTLGIPSMHVCMEFIPELLAQPQIDKQMFGLRLSGYLFKRYPLASSFGLAKDTVIPKIQSIVLTINAVPEQIAIHLPDIVEITGMIAEAFPNTVEICVEILSDIRNQTNLIAFPDDEKDCRKTSLKESISLVLKGLGRPDI
ncbi:hypothetical protein K7432_012268 [Basidiobolus ranarum]|uniref:Integrator complex subunit 2 n=1 Tax=Basidiobolus ranarum TaxID=34480 RepID=A0ABR2WL08_9FUNG